MKSLLKLKVLKILAAVLITFSVKPMQQEVKSLLIEAAIPKECQVSDYIFGDLTINSLAYNSENETLLCFSSNKQYAELLAWNLKTGVHTVTHLQDIKFGLLNPNASTLTMLTKDSFTEIYQAPLCNLENKQLFAQFPYNVISFTCSNNQIYLAALCSDNKIYIWNTIKAEIIQIIDCGYKVISGLLYSPDDSMLVAYGFNSYVWDIETGRFLSEIAGEAKAYSPDSCNLIFIDKNGVLAVWDKNKLKDYKKYQLKEFSCNTATYNNAGNQIAMGFTDGSLTLWDNRYTVIGDWKLTNSVEHFVAAISFLDSGNKLAIAQDRQLFLMDLTRFTELYKEIESLNQEQSAAIKRYLSQEMQEPNLIAQLSLNLKRLIEAKITSKI